MNSSINNKMTNHITNSTNGPDESITNTAMKTVQVLEFDLLAYLSNQGLKIIDRRPGGALWVVGGLELAPLMCELEKRDFQFRFVERGGKASENRPAWYCSVKITI